MLLQNQVLTGYRMSSINFDELSAEQLLTHDDWTEEAMVKLRTEFRKLGLLQAPKLKIEENLLRLPQAQIVFLNYFRRADLNQKEFDLLMGYLTARGMFASTGGIVGSIRHMIVERATETNLALSPLLFNAAEIAMRQQSQSQNDDNDDSAQGGSSPDDNSSQKKPSPDNTTTQDNTLGTVDQGVTPQITPPASPPRVGSQQDVQVGVKHTQYVQSLISDAVTSSLKEERLNLFPEGPLYARATGVTEDEIKLINKEIKVRFDEVSTSINPNILSYTPVTIDNLNKNQIFNKLDITKDANVLNYKSYWITVRHEALEGIDGAKGKPRSTRIDEVIKAQLVLDAITAICKMTQQQRADFRAGKFTPGPSFYQ